MAAMGGARAASGQFLVYDIGGGTFDLALVQALRGDINIIAHEGINMLGGTDFDTRLVNALVHPGSRRISACPRTPATRGWPGFGARRGTPRNWPRSRSPPPP